jgi:chorismate dehydratase
MVDENIQHVAEVEPARLGMVSFLNTAPVCQTWKRTVREPAWTVWEAPPTELNRLLYQGELDLSLISSQEYAIHSECYRILPGLAIAAAGKVGSVFLFSRYPLAALDRRRILLSASSQTSVSLTKIILEDFEGVYPEYEVGQERQEGGWDAVLSIGDEALRLAAAAEYPYRFDLAEIWYRQTGLPFVFALWGVREDFYQARPATVQAIHRELQRCLTEGLADLEGICRVVAPLIPMAEEACRRYLVGMDYDLNRDQQAGLVHFFERLIGRQEAPAMALPLKFIR